MTEHQRLTQQIIPAKLREIEARERGILSALICDAGMTEFHGQPTYTCLALEPLPIDRADELTGDLPLY